MFTGLNVAETKTYKSPNDPDKEHPTVFQLGVIDSILNAHIKDKTIEFETSSNNPKDPVKSLIKVSMQEILIVKFGLKGMENFIDPETKEPVKFDTVSTPIAGKNYMAVTDQILRMLPSDLIKELSEAILKNNTISEDKGKN